MASRAFVNDQFTNCHNPVDLTVRFLFNGTGTPTLGDGDAKQTYLTPARTNVGIYTVTTKDHYPGCTNYGVQIAQSGVPAALTNIQIAVPVQNANTTWTFTFYVYSNTTLTDPAAGNEAAIYIRMRNSTVLP